MYATAGGGSGEDPHRDPTGRDLPPYCQPSLVLPKEEEEQPPRNRRGPTRGHKTARLCTSSTTGKLRVILDPETFKAVDGHAAD